MKPPKSVSSAQNAAITGAGHAVLLLDFLEQRAVLADAQDAAVDAVLRHHAVGEFEERLRKDLLPAILVHHRLVVDHQVRGRRDRALRHALGDRLALELVEPLLEARALVARRALRERGRGGERAAASAAMMMLLQRRNGLHLDQERLLHQPVDHQQACSADRRRSGKNFGNSRLR